MIHAFRIDERLIHGQVIATWLKTLGTTHLIVASDEAAEDERRQKALKLALPSNVKCLIRKVNDAVTVLKDPRCEKMNILLIAGSPQDALRLMHKLPEISEINLANYGSITKPEVKDKVCISKMVYLDQEDADAVNELLHMGKVIFTQKTPQDSRKMVNRIRCERGEGK